MHMKQDCESVLAAGTVRIGENPANNCSDLSGENHGEDFWLNLKTLGRCGFILLGVPNIIGFAVVSGLAGMAVRMVPVEKRKTLLAAAEAFSGLVTALTGIWIARLARIEPSFWMYTVSCAWFFVYF